MLAAIEALEKLDAAEEQNEEARAEAVEFLREGIERGRATYIKPPRDPALDHAIDLLRRADLASSLRHSQLSVAQSMNALRGEPSTSNRAPSAQGSSIGQLFNRGGATKRNDDSGPATDDAG